MEVRPGDLRKNDPAAYLKGLEKDAVSTGNFTRYAREIEALGLEQQTMSKANKKAYQDYVDSVMNRCLIHKGESREVTQANQKFVNNLVTEHLRLKSEFGTAFAEAAQNAAEDIRLGIAPIDPALEPVRKDIYASTILGNQKASRSSLSHMCEALDRAGARKTSFSKYGEAYKVFSKERTGVCCA